MKKLFIVVFLGAIFVFFSNLAIAKETIDISAFVRDDCKHCQDEKAFFIDLKEEFPQIEIHYYNIKEDPGAKDLFDKITSKYELSKGTPVTLVSGKLIQGFGTADTTGAIIKDIITGENTNNVLFEDILEGGAEVITGFSSGTCSDDTGCSPGSGGFFVQIPIIKTVINVGNYSIVALSLVLGFIDGFNPCALWVLIMFLVILSQIGSKKKMWQYAGLFILAQAIMYYLILNVWLTAWDFVGLNRFVLPIVGLLAVASGVYFLYKFATYKPVCTVTNPEQRSRMIQKVKDIAKKPFTIGVAIGILALAFSVNIFEFACSIGIPQTFTKILEINEFSWLTQQWYMLLYMIMYMIDDVIIFSVGLYSIDKIGGTHKYSKWSSLIGGLLMIILGIILLTNPGLLVL